MSTPGGRVLEPMQEMKDAEQLAVRAYGRISLVISIITLTLGWPLPRSTSPRPSSKLNEWKLAQAAE
jgi:hypothetical protein